MCNIFTNVVSGFQVVEHYTHMVFKEANCVLFIEVFSLQGPLIRGTSSSNTCTTDLVAGETLYIHTFLRVLVKV